jgi:hypothetical protein
MDISNEAMAEAEAKTEETKSNEDSGVETMEIDEKINEPLEAASEQQKQATEKRKRTSSRWD